MVLVIVFAQAILMSSVLFSVYDYPSTAFYRSSLNAEIDYTEGASRGQASSRGCFFVGKECISIYPSAVVN